MREASTIPTRVAPALFFEEILKEWMEEMFSPPPPLEEVCFSIEVELSGDDGGTWTLTFDLGDYSVKPGPADDPLLRLKGNTEGWYHTAGSRIQEVGIAIEKAGGPEEFVEKWIEHERTQGHPILHLTDRKLEKLRTMPLTFEARVEGADFMQVKLAMAATFDRPLDFTLLTDSATYDALRTRKLHPMKAWTQKKVQLEGDLALAIKVAKTIQQRL